MPKIGIVGFSGTNARPRNNMAAEYLMEPGLIKLGHAGIQFEGDSRVFGFRPNQAAVDLHKGEAGLLRFLLYKKGIVTGGVFDDTKTFRRACELAETNSRLRAWIFDWSVTDERYFNLHDQMQNWLNSQAVFSYQLPLKDDNSEATPLTMRSTSSITSGTSEVFNCATFITRKLLAGTLESDLRDFGGQFSSFIPELKKKSNHKYWCTNVVQ